MQQEIYRLPPQTLAGKVWQHFLRSGKKHLFITGSIGIGKTTVRQALQGGLVLCGGAESRAVRGTRQEKPKRIVLNTLKCPAKEIVIGRPAPNKMQADEEGFAKAATLLLWCATQPGEWMVIDEIGWLESSTPVYQQAVRGCLQQKRVLACLRKDDTEFLQELYACEDAYIEDLDNLLPQASPPPVQSYWV
ncbi:MAG: nucleoside-triphosphatase [Oscillospiraceae bacterium]